VKSRKKDGKREALDLVVWARDPDTPPAGIRACPPHLTEDLHALPGETLRQLVRRALQVAKGQGSTLAVVFYADEQVLH
jgi:hypothetical protein